MACDMFGESTTPPIYGAQNCRVYAETAICWRALGALPPGAPDGPHTDLPAPPRIRFTMQIFAPYGGENLHSEPNPRGFWEVRVGSVRGGRGEGPKGPPQNHTFRVYSAKFRSVR
jgi:hypothetical protein